MNCAPVILRNLEIPDFGTEYIAGVDEAGCGALAGPVIAAAVILDPQSPIEGCADSKKLSAARRDYLAAKIKDRAHAWAIGSASSEEIDEINILNATLLAMKRAIESLAMKPQRVLIDGNRCPQVDIRCTAVIGGDDRVPCISAASILAKTTRDRQMRLFADEYPLYCFAEHKGYATRKHIAALANHGSCALHRNSWRKVQEFSSRYPLPLDEPESRCSTVDSRD